MSNNNPEFWYIYKYNFTSRDNEVWDNGTNNFRQACYRAALGSKEGYVLEVWSPVKQPVIAYLDGRIIWTYDS